jgi:hypothetical protein
LGWREERPTDSVGEIKRGSPQKINEKGEGAIILEEKIKGE